MKPSTLSERFPEKLALGRKQAAEAISLSAVTIDRLTKRGLLRPSLATRRPLYSIAELERFLRETTGSTDTTPHEGDPQ